MTPRRLAPRYVSAWYCSVMYKKIFDDDEEHGVWHFHEDIPLSGDAGFLEKCWG